MKLLRHRDTVPPSRLERKFLHFWQSLGGPELKREFRFHPTRKWRADFVHIESRTFIEIEGGIYIQGRHHRPQGVAADTEKYLEAALYGWRVLRLTEPQITAPTIERVIRLRQHGRCKVGVKRRANLTAFGARIWAYLRVGMSGVRISLRDS